MSGNPSRTSGGAVWLGALLLATTWGCGADRGSAPTYTPRARDVTITAVPLLTKELEETYPFLRDAFREGGVMSGQEVYAFSPSTVTVVQGDTIHLHLLNPEDDEHSFVIPDLGLNLVMPGQARADTTLVVDRPGVFTIVCAIPAHLPAMWGQLVVLAPDAVSSGAER